MCQSIQNINILPTAGHLNFWKLASSNSHPAVKNGRFKCPTLVSNLTTKSPPKTGVPIIIIVGIRYWETSSFTFNQIPYTYLRKHCTFCASQSLSKASSSPLNLSMDHNHVYYTGREERYKINNSGSNSPPHPGKVQKPTLLKAICIKHPTPQAHRKWPNACDMSRGGGGYVEDLNIIDWCINVDFSVQSLSVFSLVTSCRTSQFTETRESLGD